MSRQNAEANLREFGSELNLKDLKFDENNTCILGIDQKFSLHITYEPNTNKLYVYAPLLDGLPQNSDMKLQLYEKLLEGALLGGQMAGGGVGVAVKEGLILIHFTLDMGHAEPNDLRKAIPLWVEIIERWREICEDPSKSFDIRSLINKAQQAGAGAPPPSAGKPGAIGHHLPGQGPGMMRG